MRMKWNYQLFVQVRYCTLAISSRSEILNSLSSLFSWTVEIPAVRQFDWRNFQVRHYLFNTSWIVPNKTLIEYRWNSAECLILMITMRFDSILVTTEWEGNCSTVWLSIRMFDSIELESNILINWIMKLIHFCLWISFDGKALKLLGK